MDGIYKIIKLLLVIVLAIVVVIIGGVVFFGWKLYSLGTLLPLMCVIIGLWAMKDDD